MFRFKNFVINQERAAMKVCTDSCLFGSLVSTENKKNALDIGCGTGLLSLMLAQKSNALEIIALEIDAEAVKDAEANFKQSQYANQIKLLHQSVQDFTTNTDHKFDLIVSNPPFYQNNLKSDNVNKNVAHHAELLTFDELIDSIDKLLSDEGASWILLPPFEMDEFLAKAKDKKFFISKKYKVKHNETKPVFREIVELKRSKTEIEEISTINIYENNQYSPIFVRQLKDYYLIF